LPEDTAVQVGLFVPCFVDLFYPEVAIATVRVLEHLGVHVDYPEDQTCCGQPQFNTGRRDDARALALRFCRVFDRFDTIATPSGSCASMVRHHYGALVGDHPVRARVFELSEVLARHLGATNLGAKLEGRAVLHVGCHAEHELHVGSDTRTLLDHVQGLSIVQVRSSAWCCGFGGTFSVKFPEISTAMGRRKLEPMLDQDVDFLISTDSSCLMHLAGMLSREGRTRPRPVHVAEVLATCVEGA
jgi:L-lactate dehydrogenase complex protein LldE